MATLDRSITPPAPVAAPSATPGGHEPCEHCGAAMDATQRYCVNCGAHRRHVSDPAMRYLTATTARSRGHLPPRGAAGTAQRRSPTLGVALAVALIPVVAAVGLAVGRSSGGSDDKLLAALRSQHPQVINVGGGSAAGAGAGGAGKSESTAKLSTKSAGKALSTTAYGTAHQITGLHVTSAQLNQGRQIVQHIQQTQGKDYVAAQRGLPDQISVP